MNENTVRVVTALVDLVKALVWPALVVWLVLRFRTQLSELLARMASVKVAGNEFVFQQSPEKLPAVEPKSKQTLHLQTGADGFLTLTALRSLVSEFALLEKEEPIRGELLIFQTPRQRTWLIATRQRVFVLLDDERTRRKQRLVQTFFDLKETLPLEFRISGGAGVVKFAAEETWWYYSLNLFATTEALDAAVRRLIEMAS